MAHIQPSLFDGVQALEDMPIGQAIKRQAEIVIPMPTFSPSRAAALWDSVSYRRQQLASDPGNALRALWLKDAEKELAEELALQGHDPLEDLSDDELLAALLA